MEKKKESVHEDATVESSTAKDLALPLRVLISPVKTFKQLAMKPTAKGLILLVALVVVVGATAQYVSATKIGLTINGQFVFFIATSSFTNWFLGTLSTTAFTIIIYWLTAAAGLALISKFSFRGGNKVISLRATLIILGYLLSVFVVLYALRVAIYLSLPPIQFPSSAWPPTSQTEIDEAVRLMTQNWTPLPAFQLGSVFSLGAFVWLILLGAAAIKAMQEVSWLKAGLISATGFLLTLTLLGLP